MVWDGISPRAVVPGPKLSACSGPTLGTGPYAMESPVPYGVGVHKVCKNGNNRAASLFYVPESAARARGRGVLPGWYVEAKAEQVFELRITMVQEYGPKVLGRALGADEGIVIEVYVDGSRVSNYSHKNTDEIGTESHVLGFLEACRTENGELEGLSVVRPFMFQKRELIPDCGAVKQDHSGSIQIKIYTGPWRDSDLKSITWNAKSLGASSTEKVSEKEAVKYGKSIGVDRAAPLVTEKYFRGHKSVQKRSFRYDGIVNVFIRENFWLRSRSIINESGNVWVPRIERSVVDLTQDRKKRRVEKSAFSSDIIDLEIE